MHARFTAAETLKIPRVAPVAHCKNDNVINRPPDEYGWKRCTDIGRTK